MAMALFRPCALAVLLLRDLSEQLRKRLHL